MDYMKCYIWLKKNVLKYILCKIIKNVVYMTFKKMYKIVYILRSFSNRVAEMFLKIIWYQLAEITFICCHTVSFASLEIIAFL